MDFSDELFALISKLQLGDVEISIDTYIQMEIIEPELTTNELINAALGNNSALDFDLNIDLGVSPDVDDLASLVVKLSHAKYYSVKYYSVKYIFFDLCLVDIDTRYSMNKHLIHANPSH